MKRHDYELGAWGEWASLGSIQLATHIQATIQAIDRANPATYIAANYAGCGNWLELGIKFEERRHKASHDLQLESEEMKWSSICWLISHYNTCFATT